ncbi:MAG: hypothetical protein R3E99_15290 [Burkholderiaceae bacterium]
MARNAGAAHRGHLTCAADLVRYELEKLILLLHQCHVKILLDREKAKGVHPRDGIEVVEQDVVVRPVPEIVDQDPDLRIVTAHHDQLQGTCHPEPAIDQGQIDPCAVQTIEYRR